MSKTPKASMLATEPVEQSYCLNVPVMVTLDRRNMESVRLEKISRIIRSTGSSQLQTWSAT